MRNQIRIHHIEILVVAGILFLVFGTCAKHPLSKTPGVITLEKVSKENFLTDPFGYKPGIKNFTERLMPDYKLQVYSMKNNHNPKQSDTIYRFYRKKSELFVYKTMYGRELFFAANITDNKVVFKNGVKVGIDREDFFKRFNNFPVVQDDSIKIGTKRATIMFNFVFRNNKLKAIKINNYID